MCIENFEMTTLEFQDETLEQCLQRQCKKLRDLEIATVFIKSKKIMKDELVNMRTAVSHISSNVETLKKQLQEMNQQNVQLRELLELTEAMDKKILHMESNIPPELIRDYQMSENETMATSMLDETQFIKGSEITPENDIEKQENQMKDCKKMLFNDPVAYVKVDLITEEEFVKIPKYIIGRQSLETVNSFINEINQVVKTKYTFLSLGKANARKHGNMDLYLHYKKQDMDICTNNEMLYFFTEQDYERQTKTKLNKLKLNLLTVLRHCKRLREHRLKNVLHYVLTRSN